MTPEEVVCDPEFRAFCRHWREHGRCPLPLADWLRDRGLDGPADAAPSRGLTVTLPRNRRTVPQ